MLKHPLLWLRLCFRCPETPYIKVQKEQVMFLLSFLLRSMGHLTTNDVEDLGSVCTSAWRDSSLSPTHARRALFMRLFVVYEVQFWGCCSEMGSSDASSSKCSALQVLRFTGQQQKRKEHILIRVYLLGKFSRIVLSRIFLLTGCILQRDNSWYLDSVKDRWF